MLQDCYSIYHCYFWFEFGVYVTDVVNVFQVRFDVEKDVEQVCA